MKFNTVTKITFLLTLAFAFWCMAENFLVNPAQEKRKSLSQLRQEIVELLATLVQQESKVIEVTAQLQQELYKQIEDIAQGEKKSFFSGASRQELIGYSHKLHMRKELYAKELEQAYAFLRAARAPKDTKG